LGLYDSCLDNGNLAYATVIIRNKTSNSTDSKFTKREVKFGLCVPKECNNQTKLSFLNNIYKQAVITSGLMSHPEEPIYGFPKDRKD